MSSEKLNAEPRVSESESHSMMAADIRSTDGKYHRVVFDRSRKLLQFTLTGGNPKQPNCMVKDINELLSVRGTPIIIRRGLPVDLNKSAKQADTPNSLFLYFAEQRDKCKWRIREVVAVFTTSSEKKYWLDSLNSALKELEQRPKTLLIFVNPYGGKGRAMKVYAQRVELILAMADINCEVVMTQRANHAFDELKQLVDSKWNSIDGVVSVGGDGLFNECLSAIVCRSQEEAHKDITDINIDTLETPRMRFGIIGAGSANSIVSSVHGTDDCPTAAIHIAMGSQCPVDVCLVHRGDDLMRISANAISYGWLGDVLADSERYRWMGPLRYQFSALRTTFRNPSYFGRISFCLINDAEQKEHVIFPKCAEGCTICESGSVRDGPYSHHVQTDFTHVIGCVIPCVSPFTPYGLAPYAGVGDGSMDLAIVPRISRCANLRFMRKVAMHGGRSVLAMSNTLNVFRVTRWAFTPAALLHAQGAFKNSVGFRNNQGSWNLDGEILPQPADATLHFRWTEQTNGKYAVESLLDGKSSSFPGKPPTVRKITPTGRGVNIAHVRTSLMGGGVNIAHVRTSLVAGGVNTAHVRTSLMAGGVNTAHVRTSPMGGGVKIAHVRTSLKHRSTVVRARSNLQNVDQLVKEMGFLVEATCGFLLLFLTFLRNTERRFTRTTMR